MKSFEIYCDGACKGNNGESPCGWAIYIPSANISHAQGSNKGTNNIAEINALKLAFEHVYNNLDMINKDFSNNVTIVSDSEYTINSISNWSKTWRDPSVYNQKTGKKLKGNFEVKNWDLWKVVFGIEEYLVSKGIKIEYKHIMSHGKKQKDLTITEHMINANAIVDKLASDIALLYKE